MTLSPWAAISWLRIKQGKGQPIREDGPKTHLAKRGTPTMGGLMILSGLFAAVLLWGNLRNPYVWIVLFVAWFLVGLPVGPGYPVQV